ncbi:MAG TPA: dephospho-CoA kinase, partial [Chitinophagales bacterium]|nr:dephospho-CoA kinase [Chitinophagales bacterium]
MLKIGVTGGIGSGKTTVCLLFQQLFNIPVYYADVRAKHIINENQIIKEQIVALFGEEAYLNNEYNRTFIASKVFNNNTLLQQLNAIVHPAV